MVQCSQSPVRQHRGVCRAHAQPHKRRLWGYYTLTPRSGPNKTARAAVLHGSMFSKPCAPAQGRVPCTRAAAQAAALRLLYHIFKLTLRALLAFTKKYGIYAARLMLRLRLAFTNRTYYTCRRSAATTKPHVLRFCMVQCSQSPVRQHRGVCLAHAQPRKRQLWGYYTTSPGRLHTFFFKSPDKLRLNMLQ